MSPTTTISGKLSLSRQFTEWIALVLAMLMLGGVIAFTQYKNYVSIEKDERNILSHQADLIEKNLSPQLVAMNNAMNSILEQLPNLTQKDAERQLLVLNDLMPSISLMFLTDATGKVTASTMKQLIGINLSHRDYFQVALKQRQKDTLFVASPFKSVLGNMVIALVREVTGPGGEFNGVLVSALDEKIFGQLLDSVRYAPDMFCFIAHGDGKLFMSMPKRPELYGLDLAIPGNFFSRHKANLHSPSLFSGRMYASGDDRLAAFKTVQPDGLHMDKPLVVSVSRNLHVLFAPWRNEIQRNIILITGLFLVSSLALFFYQRRYRFFERSARTKELALKASESRLNAFFNASPDAMLISNAQGIISMTNLQTERLLGYSANELLGHSIEELVPLSARPHHPALRTSFANETTTRRMGRGTALKARRKDGSECDVEISLSPINTDQGLFFGTTLRDITERKKAQGRIEELAFFDQLTSLPNRTLLLDRLKQAITLSARGDIFGALLLIDLDNFKTLNDTLGHDCGDQLLKQVSARLLSCVREGDTVARLGGDEFMVILTGLNGNPVEAAMDAEAVVEKICAALKPLYTIGSIAHLCTVSIGITMYCGQGTQTEDLMKQADLAMYRAKAAGRNAWRFFDADMETAVIKGAALEQDLRAAIRDKQFLLHYQAQIDALGNVTGAEVLVRWLHPQRGMVSPADFIPLAEETGMIVPIGQWVLETACTQLAQWANHPEMKHLTLAVNVSAHQFNRTDFVEQVLLTVSHSGANPFQLKLELTESLMVANVEEIIQKMQFLKSKGIAFSLDDFGTGYSSLAYLKRLPLDQLKIDQSFVQDVLIDTNDATIAKTIVIMAHSMGFEVIAEGVETQAQRDFLAIAGCEAYQGFFFSRPLSVEGFEAFVRGKIAKIESTSTS